MEIIKLSSKNIQDEHICCAFSSKDAAAGYQMKKNLLKTQFKDGYTFQKLDVKGKVFIEYVPIEASWLPIEGSNFMLINCFWVSGKYKGSGYGKKLLEKCFQDASSMDGVITITAEKKRPFMNDPNFFKKQGFELIDEAPPYFKLWGKKNKGVDTRFPKFKTTAKKGVCENKKGITVYYSNSCPFTEFYNRMFLQAYADKKGIPLQIHQIKSKVDGKKMPIPWIINSVFYEGNLVTLDIKADKHLDKYIEKLKNY